MLRLLKLLTLCWLLFPDGDDGGDGKSDGGGGDSKSDASDGDKSGGETNALEYRAERIEACLKAGVDLRGIDDVDQWLRDHTAFGDGGRIIVHDVPEEHMHQTNTDSQSDSKDSDSKGDEKLTETQKAIKHGDPSVPAHVHRSIMATAGARTKSALDEPVSLSKMHDKEYRRELQDRIADAPEGALRAGLVERSRDVYSRDPLTQAALAGKRETLVPGDLATA